MRKKDDNGIVAEAHIPNETSQEYLTCGKIDRERHSVISIKHKTLMERGMLLT